MCVEGSTAVSPSKVFLSQLDGFRMEKKMRLLLTSPEPTAFLCSRQFLLY